MKITNYANLPQPLVKAVENDGYSKGDADYSCTELGVPSRIVALKKIHADKLTEEAADLIYALIGKLGHSILEHAGTADLIEKRLFHTMPDGTVVSGCMDVVDKTVIEDWKFTSVWTSKNGVKFEWESQASVNAFLCYKNDIKITAARYIAIYRDWSRPKVERERDYPKHQVECFDVPLWSLEKTEAWIIERIRSHKSADKVLPLCTDEERWARGSGVAVMKKGRKTAVKLFESESSAVAFVAEQEKSSDLYTEIRPGSNMRCDFYCQVSKFCDQAKDLGVRTEPIVTLFDDPEARESF